MRYSVAFAAAVLLGLSACGSGNDTVPDERVDTTAPPPGSDDARPQITAQVPLDTTEAKSLAVADGKVFVVDDAEVAVFSESESPTEDARVPFSSKTAYELTAGEGAVWGASEDSLEQIDPVSLTSQSSVLLNDLDGVGRLAVGDGYVFVNRNSGLTRFDPAGGAEKEFKGVEVDAAGDGGAWGEREESGFLVRSNPDTLAEEARVRLPDYSFDVEIGEGMVWVVTADGSLVGVDPATNAVAVGPVEVPTTDVEVGVSGLDAAVGLGGVWVGDGHSLTVHRFDPATGELTDSLPLAGGDTASGGDVYVSVGADAVWATSTDADGAGVTLTRIDPGSASSNGEAASTPESQPLTPADQDEMDTAARDFLIHVGGTFGTSTPPDETTCSENGPPVTQAADRNASAGITGGGNDACVAGRRDSYENRCAPEYSGGQAQGDSEVATFTASLAITLLDNDNLPRGRGSAQVTLNFVRPLNDWLIDGMTPPLSEVCEQIDG